MDLIITDTEIRLGDFLLSRPFHFDQLSSFLGPPSRRTDKVNLILTYDAHGLYFHTKDGNQIEQIGVAFDPGWFDFFPTHRFSGRVYVRGAEVRSPQSFSLIATEDELDRNEEEAEGFLGLDLGEVSCSLEFDLETRALISVEAWYTKGPA